MAKRVRFLLGKEDRRVDIVTEDAFEVSLSGGHYDLVVLSNGLDELLPVASPSAIILGGTPDALEPTRHVIEDPEDAGAISAAATEILGGGSGSGAGSGSGGSDEQPVDPRRLASVLFEAFDNRRSGRLVVERQDETWTLAFDEGTPVLAKSSVPGEDFGRALVSKGRVSESQYGDAAKHVVERGVDLGTALLELDILDPASLDDERAQHVRAALVARFEPGSGTFRFVEGSAPHKQEFRLQLLPVMREGFKAFARPQLVHSIVGEDPERYFRLTQSSDELADAFELDASERAFIQYGGRAYNVSDASELCGLSIADGLMVLALLSTCGKVEDFTPGVGEFEARIKEEKERTKGLSQLSHSPLPDIDDEPFEGIRTGTPIFEAPQPIHSEDASDDSVEILADIADSGPAVPLSGSGPSPGTAPFIESAPHPGPPSVPISSPSNPSSRPIEEDAAPRATPPPPPGSDIPTMPSAGPGEASNPAEPMVFAPPAPRGPDGQLVDTPERQRSKEVFQKGVQMLGQGHFDMAEQHFREAITLCSDEHVYMVGLARAVFYNPAYSAEEKIPLLRSILRKAETIAPGDQRVVTLRSWIEHNAAGL